MPRLLVALVPLVLAACATAPPTSPLAELFVLHDPAPLTTADGVRVAEGGFSGLDVVDGVLVAVTDRGPNVEAEGRAGRPAKRFLAPAYAPFVATLVPRDGHLVLRDRLPLRRPGGAPVSGLPVPDEAAGVVETAYGPVFETLAPDAWGLDAEGLAADGTGGWWVADEYRPSLWRVGADGRVAERFTPRPAGPADRPLPAVLLEREDNRGFEGVGVWPGGRVVASLQSPLQVGGVAAAGSVLSRLLLLDPATGAAETVAFALDGPLRKVGDLAALDAGRLLILEHGPAGAGQRWTGHVYLVDVREATRIPDGVALEPLRSAGAARAAGVRLATKTPILDLLAAGWPPDAHKPEGLGLDGRTLWVLSDNDFGLDAPGADGLAQATGQQTVLARFVLPRRP